MTGAIVKILYLFIAFILVLPLKGQDKKPEKSYLLTGVVMDLEERSAMPYVNVRIKNTGYYGTATDIHGYFSLFVNPGDTLEFSYVGYEDATFIMPFELDEEQYTLLQLMHKDTLLLEEVVVFPWPEYHHFTDAFLDELPPEDYMDLVKEVNRDLDENLNDVEKSQYYYKQQRYQRLFRMHRIFPPYNFLNPERWADFIRDISTEDEGEDD